MSNDQSNFELFAIRVMDEEELDGTEFSVFRVPSKENTDWPHISFIWRGGDIEREEGSGSQTFGDCIVTTPLRDEVDMEIHVWHEDFKKTEALRNCVLNVLYRLQGSRFRSATYEWFNEQDATAEINLSGVKCILRCRVDLAIGSETQKATIVTTITNNNTWQDAPEGSTPENDVC